MTWFCVTLLTFYDQKDRDFAARARVRDPSLLRVFVVADAKASTNNLRWLARFKYILTGGQLALLLEVACLNDLPVFTLRAAVVPVPRYFANVTAAWVTEGRMVIYSHFYQPRGREYIQASSELIRGYQRHGQQPKGERRRSETGEPMGSRA